MSTWQTAGKVRMTPKGTHNANTAYEILDIVSYSSGSLSYIAKQAVPAGTALTNTTYWAVIADVQEALNNVGAALSYIADEYSTSSTYAIGDYVIYDGYLYRCITAINSGESWTSGHWTAVSITSELEDFADDVIKVSATQPTDHFNKIWVDTSTEEISVPTYAEYSDLKSAIETRIPNAPTTNGNYILKATVSGGTASYSWESVT